MSQYKASTGEEERHPLNLYRDDLPKSNGKVKFVIIACVALIVVLVVLALALAGFVIYKRLNMGPVRIKEEDVPGDYIPYEYVTVMNYLDYDYYRYNSKSYGLDPGCICVLPNDNYMFFRRDGGSSNKWSLAEYDHNTLKLVRTLVSVSNIGGTEYMVSCEHVGPN